MKTPGPGAGGSTVEPLPVSRRSPISMALEGPRAEPEPGPRPRPAGGPADRGPGRQAFRGAGRDAFRPDGQVSGLRSLCGLFTHKDTEPPWAAGRTTVGREGGGGF